MLRVMKPLQNRLLFVMAGVLAVGAAQSALAEARTNPYQSIVERNPFGLRPPPPPPDPTPPAPAVPPAKVVLTGISTLGQTKALLEITEQEPGKPAAVHKPILMEGERDGSIEVVSIDLEKSIVRIRNAGMETNVTFETPKLTPGPAAPAAGFPPPPLNAGAPGLPGGSLSPGNTASRTGVTIAGGGTPAPTVGAAAPTGVNPNGVTPGAAYNPAASYNNNASSGGLRTIPSRSLRTDTPNPAVDGSGAVNPVVQRQMLELNKQAADSVGFPYPPPPPPYTPDSRRTR